MALERSQNSRDKRRFGQTSVHGCFCACLFAQLSNALTHKLPNALPPPYLIHLQGELEEDGGTRYVERNRSGHVRDQYVFVTHGLGKAVNGFFQTIVFRNAHVDGNSQHHR